MGQNSVLSWDGEGMAHELIKEGFPEEGTSEL